MTDLEKSYIAGIIDGEGSIVIQKMLRKHSRYAGKPSYAMQVSVEMGCEEVPRFILEKTGLGSLHSRKRIDRSREMFSWVVSGNKAKDFLIEIKDFLVYKQGEAELAIEFQNTMKFQSKWFRLPKEIIDLRENLYIRLKDKHYAL